MWEDGHNLVKTIQCRSHVALTYNPREAVTVLLACNFQWLSWGDPLAGIIMRGVFMDLFCVPTGRYHLDCVWGIRERKGRDWV
jgi:hypothetical protein